MTIQTPLIPDQLQVQIGKETTWGTIVAATAKLMGVETCELEPVVDAIQLDEIRGSLFPAHMSNLVKIGAKGKVSGIVSTEDIPYWLDSMCGLATPAGSYTYSYLAPGATMPTPRIFTLIKGSGPTTTNTYTGHGMIATDLEISGKTNEKLKYAVNLIGEEVAPGTLAALADRTVNDLSGDQVALWIDAFGGTIGTTAITTAFMEFRLKLNANRAMFPAMGSLKPAGYNEAKWKGCELYMKLIFDATTKAYVDAVLAGSSVISKLVRIKATKSAGQSLQLDFAGSQLSAIQPFGTDSGLVVIEMKLAAEYETTFANIFKAVVTNTVSALP